MMDWDRDNPLAPVDGETAKASQALNDYAQLGPGRSLAGLCERYQSRAETAPTRQLTTLKQWSTTYDWQARVARWQELQNERARAEYEALWAERRRQQREAEWDARTKLIERAHQMLAFPLAQVERQVRTRQVGPNTVIEEHTTVAPARWSFRDVAAYFEAAAKLARLAAEMETERGQLAVDLSPEELQRLSDADLEALIARLSKPK